MPKKLTYSQVKNIFVEGGCHLLSDEYKNSATKLKYECECGNISTAFLHNFKKGHRCSSCGVKKVTNSTKLSFEYVKKFFVHHGCTLISNSYGNNIKKLRYICECGDVGEISFSNFQTGRRCKKCGYRSSRESQSLTFEYVEQYFKNYNCILLSTKYINALIKLKYICSCGNKSEISFNSFRQGVRCIKCGIEKNSGKNHYNYNPNLTDEDRRIRRKFPGYSRWRINVLNKDDYACQKCFKMGCKLNAHHIEGYAENKHLRTEVLNGVTFCQDCHNLFHAIYGKKNVNRKQLDEFINMDSLCLK